MSLISKENISCKHEHYKGQTRPGPNRRRVRRGGKNTQNYKKIGLSDRESHNGAVTHVEPDILEGEVTWALGSIAANKDR